MKKTILITFTIIIILVTIISVKYFLYQNEYREVLSENKEFEQYLEKEIYGIELGSIINKAIDKNYKNKIEKDEKNIFIPNEENSIQIDVYMVDSEETYKMESIYNAGMEQFIKHYGNIKFKCSDIQYHKNTNKIRYMLFEQLGTS